MKPSRRIHYESIDNSRNENDLFNKFMSSYTHSDFIKLTIVRWTLVMVTAILTSCLAVILRIFRIYVVSAVFKPYLIRMITPHFPQDPVLAFAGWMGVSMLSMLIASALVVYVEPSAGGNDIADVIASTNGVLMRKQYTLRRNAVIFISMMAHIPMSTICTGVAPMLKLGAAVGYLLPNMLRPKEQVFLGQQDERRTLAFCGMSAGLSAGLDAPVAALFLAIEHTSINYSRDAIALYFVSSIISTVFTQICMTNLVKVLLDKDSLEARRDTFYGEINDSTVVYWNYELLVYAAVGVLGGITGSLWTYLSIRVSQLHRMMHRGNKFIILVQALLYAGMVAGFQMSLLYFSHSCVGIDSIQPEYTENMMFTEKFFMMPRINCDLDEIPDAGIIMISPHLIMTFMIYAKPMAFSLAFLATLVVALYIFSLISASLSAAGGVFLSHAIIGSLWGRLLGELVNSHVKEEWSSPTKFALLGAAAQMTGVFHYSLVVVVLLVETTASYQSYCIPLLITCVTARCVSYFIKNRSYYEMIFRHEAIPFISPTIPYFNVTAVTQIMAKPVISLSFKVKVRRIMEVLEQNKGKYPICSSKGFVLGDISRTYLCAMLLHKVYNLKQPLEKENYTSVFYALCRTDSTMEFYEKAMKTLRNTLMDPVDYDKTVSLKPFMNHNFFEVRAETDLASVYTFVRQTGAHSLYVTQNGKLLGVVTRKDIVHVIDHGK